MATWARKHHGHHQQVAAPLCCATLGRRIFQDGGWGLEILTDDSRHVERWELGAIDALDPRLKEVSHSSAGIVHTIPVVPWQGLIEIQSEPNRSPENVMF